MTANLAGLEEGNTVTGDQKSAAQAKNNWIRPHGAEAEPVELHEIGGPAILALEDGRVFRGYSFGAERPCEGEVVFNTSMTGYQEICTDPSYRGEIVCLTYPLIGNYGSTLLDDESREPWISGLIVRDYTPYWSNWRGEDSLHQYLKKHNIPGIYGLDTRALTRHLRNKGLMRGVIVRLAPGMREEDMVNRARHALMPADKNVVGDVTTPAIYRYPARSLEGQNLRLAVLDCGLKENILRSLARRGVDATVVPYDASLGDILAIQPDAVFTSPGPGDPERNLETIETLQGIISRQIPFFGICLGHQLLGLSIGATTSRLKFGHRGGNHPVKDLTTGEVHITSQNHGFQVDADSVPTSAGWRVSQINLNDDSVEGLAHESLPAFSVQYHPEGSPGPQDNQYLFDRFLAMVQDKKQSK
ncbi:MAG TPA: glutamine-hydrolyzing carbamoyl-phosphate synthase small subunit [Chloroflexia bacterium]|nr:glutamine-hydrolyzing carbamoyl-phosphate synthase small subunit [Chloroflexia bacterium]